MSRPAAASAPSRAERLAAWRLWAQGEAQTWVYIFKTAFAALLALYLSMRLELPAPSTAMVTVFVVTQPQSGAVFAKSFYRLLGTLIGLVATIVFIGAFAQSRDAFLLAVAAWISVCTAGAARNRNFRSYGFVLAGYTTALAGLPNVEHALGAFDAGVTRALEVSLGVLTAGAVSALILPQKSAASARVLIYSRFNRFVEFLRDATSGKLDRAGLEQRNMAFIADVVGLEALRSYATFEDPETRARSGRVSRLNSEFMAVSTRFHALHQLVNRLHARERHAATAVFTPYIVELGENLTLAGSKLESAAQAREIARQLSAYQQSLPPRIRASRAQLAEAGASDADLLDYDTAAELLYRLADETSAYAQTYGSLDTTSHALERGQQRYAPKTHMLSAWIAGVRAAVTVLSLSVFWICSSWPSGYYAVLNAGAICAIVSSVPQPAKLAKQMLMGGVLAVLLGYVALFTVLPYLDGFPMLAAGLLPFIFFGLWLSLQRRWAGVGIGFCIFFTASIQIDNHPNYDVTTYLNNGLALLLALTAAWVSFATLLPPTTGWLLRRMEASLRGQMRFAAFGRRYGLAHRFENGTRDFMSQLSGITAEVPAQQRRMLGWMFSVLEIGHAVIELRQEWESLPPEVARDPRYDADGPWRRTTRALRAALVELFDTPTPAHFEQALFACQRAIAATRGILEQGIADGSLNRTERHRVQRCLSYLHFIRTAMLDTHSPLAALRPEARIEPEAA